MPTIHRFWLSAILLAGAILLAACGPSRPTIDVNLPNADAGTQVIFDNDSACNPIKLRLTNIAAADLPPAQHSIQPGERYVFQVQADVFYEYIVDFTASRPDADGFRCTSLEEGKFSVPRGQTLRFPLTSTKITPVPT